MSEPLESRTQPGAPLAFARALSARTTGTLIQATGLEVRVRALAELVTEAGSPALVVSSVPRMQARLLERALPGRGVAWLSATLVSAEWDLRLAEVAAGVHPLVVVDARLLWDSQFVVALTRLRPRLVAFDATLDAEVDSADRWALALQIARVRQVFPATMVAAVGTPTSPWARDWVAARLGNIAAVPREGLVPPGVALRTVRVEAERDRWGAVLDAAPPPGDPMLLVTLSRSGAIAAAKRLGSTAIAYHGGLSLGERAAILEAYRRRPPRTLVVTQTLLRTDDLPPPATIVLTHPPRRPEILTYLMGWAARAKAPVPLLVVYAPSDLATARAGGSHPPRPTLSDLRDVYRATRRLAHHGYARILPEALAPADGPFRGQTALVVSGLHALEAAGYLSRGDDVSRATTLTVRASEGVSLVEWGLPPMESGVAPPVDPLVAAFEQGLDPIQWQRRAATAALDGLLLYRSAGREWLYQLREPVREAAAALRREVRERVEWAAEDARLIAGWLEAPGCRARALASGMDWPVPNPCGLCDICVPAHRGVNVVPNEPWHLALRALAEIPLAVPEGAAVRIVQQALRRAGRPGDSRTTLAALTRLREDGLIRLEAGAIRPRMVVTDEGRSLLTARNTKDGNTR